MFSILATIMRKEKKVNYPEVKRKVRTWYGFERSAGKIIHNDNRFFFAWKDGCLVGTYNTLDEATDSLAVEESKTRSAQVLSPSIE
jgi:hypothetical protein